MASGSELASAWISLYPKFTKDFNRTVTKSVSTALGQAAKGVSSTGNAIGKKLGDGIKSGLSTTKVALGNVVATGITSALGAVTSSVDGAISRIDTMENFPMTMEAWGESSEHAAATIDRLVEGVEGLPTKTDEITSNVRRLYTTLGDLDKSADLGIALNDMMLANGASTELANNAFEQFVQMLAMGKVDMQAWRSVVNAAPKAVDDLAKSLLGATATSMDLYNAMNGSEYAKTNGVQVEFEELTEAIIEMGKNGGEGVESFAAQARKASKGIATSMKNVRTAIEKNMANALKGLGRDRIAGYFETMKKHVNEFGAWFNGAKIPQISALLDRFDFDGAIRQVRSAIAQVTNLLKDTFAPMAKMLGNHFGEINAQFDRGLLGHLFGVIVPQLSNFVKILDRIVDKALSAFSPNASGLAERASSFLLNAYFAMDEALTFVFDHVVPPLTRIFKAVADVVGAGMSSLSRNKEAFKGFLSSFFGASADVIVTIANVVAQYIPIIIDKVAQLATKLTGKMEGIDFGSLLMGAFDNVVGVIEWARNTLAPLLDTVFGPVKPHIPGIFAAISSMLPMLVEAARGFFAFLSDNAPTIGNIFGNVAEIASKSLEAIAGFMSDNWGGVSETVGNLATNAIELLDKVVTYVNENWSTIGPLLIGAFIGFKAFLPMLSTLAGAFSTVAGAAGGLIGEGGILSSLGSGGGILASLGGEGGTIANIATKLGSLPGILGNVVSKINPITAAISAVIGAFIYWFSNFDSFRETAGGLLDSAKEALGGFLEPFNPIIEKIGGFFDSLVNEHIPNFTSKLKEIMDKLEPVGEFIVNVIRVVVQVLTPILSTIGTVIATIADIVLNVLGGAFEVVSGIVSGLLDIISGFIDIGGGIVDALGGFFQPIADTLFPPTEQEIQKRLDALAPPSTKQLGSSVYDSDGWYSPYANGTLEDADARWADMANGVTTGLTKEDLADVLSSTDFGINMDKRRVAGMMAEDNTRAQGSLGIYASRGLA